MNPFNDKDFLDIKDEDQRCDDLEDLLEDEEE